MVLKTLYDQRKTTETSFVKRGVFLYFQGFTPIVLLQYMFWKNKDWDGGSTFRCLSPFQQVAIHVLEEQGLGQSGKNITKSIAGVAIHVLEE